MREAEKIVHNSRAGKAVIWGWIWASNDLSFCHGVTLFIGRERHGSAVLERQRARHRENPV